ncbi:MAG: hypothetical protein LBE89_05185 [Helicobacteraceae bacterium]|nr:hypothetical protein [Helicobacteraceae bacterium]
MYGLSFAAIAVVIGGMLLCAKYIIDRAKRRAEEMDQEALKRQFPELNGALNAKSGGQEIAAPVSQEDIQTERRSGGSASNAYAQRVAARFAALGYKTAHVRESVIAAENEFEIALIGCFNQTHRIITDVYIKGFLWDCHLIEKEDFPAEKRAIRYVAALSGAIDESANQYIGQMKEAGVEIEYLVIPM